MLFRGFLMSYETNIYICFIVNIHMHMYILN